MARIITSTLFMTSKSGEHYSFHVGLVCHLALVRYKK